MDVRYSNEINIASSNIEITEINNKYSKSWLDYAAKYYNSLRSTLLETHMNSIMTMEEFDSYLAGGQ